MNYVEFKQTMKEYPLFSLMDIRKLFPKFSRIQLNRWQDKNLIKKIIKKYYIFADEPLNESIFFLIANKIFKPSYVSLEMALSYYNFIPEGVFIVTSVTSKKTCKFETELINFHYRKVKPELFWGYRLVNYEDWNFLIAEPEKALLDYFYLNPDLKTEGDFEELRINPFSFQEEVDLDKFNLYLKAFKNKQLTKRMNIFLTFMKNAQS